MYNTKIVLQDGTTIYPGYLDREKREELKNEYGTTRGYMWCGCRSDQKLFYRISEDLKIYPEHNNYKHDRNCCRFRTDTGEEERKTAYVVSDEDGTVTAYLKFNPKKLDFGENVENEESNSEEEFTEDVEEEVVIEKEEVTTKKESKKEPKLSLSSLIRSINMDTYAEVILNNKKINSRELFSKLVYFRMKKVKVSRMKKSIGDLTLENDGVRFFYFPFAGLVKLEDKGLTKCYIKTIGKDGKVYNNLIFPETLEKLKKDFFKMYGGMEPNKDTMIAGFQYYKKSKSGIKYKVLGRVHLFQTSELGIYCRSILEKETFDTICSITFDDNKLKLWIPADDESIGGIIQVSNKQKDILILFRSSKDERITFDNSMYEPFVVGENEPVTKDRLYKAIGYME